MEWMVNKQVFHFKTSYLIQMLNTAQQWFSRVCFCKKRKKTAEIEHVSINKTYLLEQSFRPLFLSYSLPLSLVQTCPIRYHIPLRSISTAHLTSGSRWLVYKSARSTGPTITRSFLRCWLCSQQIVHKRPLGAGGTSGIPLTMQQLDYVAYVHVANSCSLRKVRR